MSLGQRAEPAMEARRSVGQLQLLLVVVVAVLLGPVAGGPAATAVSLTPEGMAAEVPTCESAAAHSHATCEAEFHHLVQRFNMIKTPANTYFAPVYSSDQLSADGQPITNTILELQPAGTRIPWLRTNVTTQLFLWYHRGAPLVVHALLPDGQYTRQVLGDPLRHPEAHYQMAMPFMTWVSTEVLSDTEYVLLSGSAVPAFNRLDYDLADPAQLIADFPKHRDVIMAAYAKVSKNLVE